MDEKSTAPTAVPDTVETVEFTKTLNQPADNSTDQVASVVERKAEIEKPDEPVAKADEEAPTSAPETGNGVTIEATAVSEDRPSASKAPSDAEISKELLKYLQEDSFTMDVTERQLRNRLETHFGVPLKDRKAIIRDKIMEFIETKQDIEEAGAGEEHDAGQKEEPSISDDDEEDQPVKKNRRGGGGLNASCHLSEAMQAFLGEESMSRPQVVKALWKYIKDNDLQDASNKRKIILDEKLATLFTKPLDMFSMNRQLSKHVKTNDTPSTAEAGDSDGGSPKSASKPKRKTKPSSDRSAKKARVNGGEAGKKASAFTRPLKVSPELSSWLGGETEISRPQLTKRFWEYAKENNLLDPSNKKMIICDEALKGLTGEETFQCFGFAKYFKKHLLGYADQAE